MRRRSADRSDLFSTLSMTIFYQTLVGHFLSTSRKKMVTIYGTLLVNFEDVNILKMSSNSKWTP